MSTVSELWVYLAASPLTGLTVTLVVYILAQKIYLRCGSNPLLNPVALSVIVLIGLLLSSKTPYQTYFDGAQFIHFLLGPATVALAIPLYEQMDRIKEIWQPIAITMFVGVGFCIFSTVAIAKLFGASFAVQMSLAPKSVTSPVAMGIAEHIGGIAPLTAVLVVTTGIIGAIIGGRIFSLLGLTEDSSKGIAMGLTAHGIGTARAFQISAEMGAFAGLAMALSTVVTIALMPFALHVIEVLMGF